MDENKEQVVSNELACKIFYKFVENCTILTEFEYAYYCGQCCALLWSGLITQKQCDEMNEIIGRKHTRYLEWKNEQKQNTDNN